MGTRAPEYRLLASASRPEPGWIAALAGVALLDWRLAAVLHPQSWRALILSIALLILASMFLAWIVASIASRDKSSGPVVMAAVWIAPIAVFLSVRSYWAIPPAIFASIAWTRVGGIGGSQAARAMIPSFCAAVCIQLGVAAAIAEQPVIAASLLSLGASIITRRVEFTHRQWTLKRSSRTIALAAVFTAIGLFGYLPHRWGSGSSSGGGGDDDVARGTGIGARRTDVYRGVILWPEEQTYVTLVPPLPAMSHRLFQADQRNPLSIPFYGAYWFFKPPDRRPPPNAIVMRGDPASSAFRSNDGVPLAMEAHQNLGKLIDLACCSRIQMAVRNADHYAGEIALELILFNTSLPAKPRQSLGMDLLESGPRTGAIEETLNYPIPANPAILQFDEFTIRFSRQFMLSNRSARIAIEKFVLVPR